MFRCSSPLLVATAGLCVLWLARRRRRVALLQRLEAEAAANWQTKLENQPVPILRQLSKQLSEAADDDATDSVSVPSRTPSEKDGFRLDAAQEGAFLTHGYLILPPSPFVGAATHDAIYRKSCTAFKEDADPGNNILPHVPELLQVFEAPDVSGALASLLGESYMLHAHRRAHLTSSGREAQAWHKDTYKGRQYQPNHRLEWVMALYFPQETPLELGPTELWPGTQYFRGDYGVSAETQQEQWATARLPLACAKGSVVLIHYDIWHRAGHNKGSPPSYRVMHKFQFARMSPPEERATAAAPPQMAPVAAPWLTDCDAASQQGTGLSAEAERAVDLPLVADAASQIATAPAKHRTRLQGEIVRAALARLPSALASERKAVVRALQRFIEARVRDAANELRAASYCASLEPVVKDVHTWLHGGRAAVATAASQRAAVADGARCVPELLDVAESKRLAAAYRLGRAGHVSALDKVFSDGATPTVVRRTVVYGLIAAGAEAESAQHLVPLDGRLRDTARPATSSGEVDALATTVADSLEEGGLAAQARRAHEGFDFELSKPASDVAAELQYCAAFVVASLQGDGVIAALLRCASDVDGFSLSARIVAAEGLGRQRQLGSRDADVWMLLSTNALTHPAEDMRCAAALAIARLVRLAQFGHCVRIEALQAMLDDRCRYVQAYAFEALVRLVVGRGCKADAAADALRSACSDAAHKALIEEMIASSAEPWAQRWTLARRVAAARWCALTSARSRW